MCLIPNNPFFISCKESRIESPTSLYGCFSLGLFEMSQSLTIANALRRTLLSNVYGIAITSVKIEGVFHEYSNIPGIRESVLDILLNLKQVVLKYEKMFTFDKFEKTENLKVSENKEKNLQFSQNFPEKFFQKFILKKPLYGYLQARGPGIVRARDLRLPFFIQCVDPMQYIATLSEDGLLNMKFEIGSFFTQKSVFLKKKESEKKILDFQQSEIKNQENSSNSLDSSNFIEKYPFNKFSTKFQNISLDAVFRPVSKVNFVLEFSKQFEQQIFDHRILLEVWTNGSLHPRQAVYQAIKNLIRVFVRLEKAEIS